MDYLYVDRLESTPPPLRVVPTTVPDLICFEKCNEEIVFQNNLISKKNRSGNAVVYGMIILWRTEIREASREKIFRLHIFSVKSA
jgi:hypothetical protein